MTYLADLVDPFKREVAIPGTFAVDFPLTSDDDLEAALGDAFSQAQLDGFFPNAVLDVDSGEVLPDLSNAGAALVVLYAGTRMVRQRLRTLGVNRRYKAGPVETETSIAVSLLVQELKDLQGRMNKLVEKATGPGGGPTSVYMLDAYMSREWSLNTIGGFYPAEIPATRTALTGA